MEAYQLCKIAKEIWLPILPILNSYWGSMAQELPKKGVAAESQNY